MNFTTTYLLCHGLNLFLSPYTVTRGIDQSMANAENARGFQLKDKSSDVELSVFAESERNVEEQFSNLGAADVTPDKLKTKQPLMSSSSLESRTGFVFHPAASVTQNLGSNSGLGFRSISQNTRHPKYSYLLSCFCWFHSERGF